MQNIKDYEKMAKLDLSGEERRQIAAMVDRLIDSFGALADIDTEGVEPLYTVLDVQNVFREDICTKTFTREEILANAPMQYDGYFQVPKTL
ncbi:MAG: Asp-tRNA(Asn)/Glu-tRNA(Gln) amidotransferase subunit GatC [Planctomycetaceae bacterium]|nr:Asp-tRNA(Asn)/Glu-tRNA(Gln) amidotransferase subunit GatC [Planctomycetaceae bacterium]